MRDNAYEEKYNKYNYHFNQYSGEREYVEPKKKTYRVTIGNQTIIVSTTEAVIRQRMAEYYKTQIIAGVMPEMITFVYREEVIHNW